jgi:hypothetical protein
MSPTPRSPWSMKLARVVPSVLIVLLASVVAQILPGCSDGPAPRSLVAVESVNNNAILNSDVYNNGSDKERGTADDFIPEEQVPIVVRNIPHDAGLRIRANGAFSTVVIQRYEVRFGGDVNLPSFGGSLYLRVPSGGSASASVVVIPASYKVSPPLDAIIVGSIGEYRLNASVTLFGYEEDSEDPITATGTLAVNVADWMDE